MTREGVVLITDADSDAGYRVVVTAKHASRLTRILLGQNADQVIAIAADLADPIQRSQLLERAGIRLGRVRWILDGRTGSVSALKLSDNDVAMPPTAEYPPLSRAS